MTRATVSPVTSARYRASSTSFRRSGRMMATMSFIWSVLPASARRGLRGQGAGGRARRAGVGDDEDGPLAVGVRLLAVLGHVHAEPLGARHGAERGDQRHQLEDDERG